MRTCFQAALGLALMAGTSAANAQATIEQPTHPAIMLAQLQTVVTPPSGIFVPQPLGSVVEPPADAVVSPPSVAPAPVVARPVKTAARQPVRKAAVRRAVVARGAARSPRREQPRVTTARHRQKVAVVARRLRMTPGPRTAVNRKARQQRVVAAARTRRAAIGAAATRRIVAAAPVLAEDEMGMGFPVAGPAVSTPVVTNYAVAPQPAPFYAAPAPAIPVRAYTSVYFNGRRLLIDPVTNAVVGELYW